ncbi:MAG TPA: hypothetical protein VD837_16190 [Terriglobales bacterium]|nr:hypothetical protein [Terriglobales bacterium]
MLRMLVFAVFLVAAVGQDGTLLAQERVLDLTNVPKATRRFHPSRGTLSGIYGGLTDGSAPSGPLTLTLLRADVGANDELVVRLTNKDSQPLCIPNDPQVSDVEPLTPQPFSYTGGTISLHVTDARGQITALDGIQLVDDASHAHCEKLALNESLRIRAKKDLATPTDVRPMLRGRVQVNAVWSTFSARVWFADGQIYSDYRDRSPVISYFLLICVTDCNGSSEP